MGDRINLVRSSAGGASPQGLQYFVGVSREKGGARGISLSLVVVPPGAISEPHFHDGFETAIYQLSGRVETRFGPKLAESVVSEAGDFLFIPADLPHQAINLSDSEPASAIVARNDAAENENVVPYEPGG